MIIGSGGSGKSTLAKRLGETLGLPVIHLDNYFWQSGWIPADRDEFVNKQEEFAAGQKWIMDGSFSAGVHQRLARATSVILLDFNRVFCIVSVIKRYFQYRGKTRPDLHEGCPEKLDLPFLKWIWAYPKRSKPFFLEKIAMYPGVKLIVIKSRKELSRVYDTFRSGTTD